MEENGTEVELNCGGVPQVASEEKNVIMWSRDCSCEILMKSVA